MQPALGAPSPKQHEPVAMFTTNPFVSARGITCGPVSEEAAMRVFASFSGTMYLPFAAAGMSSTSVPP